MILQFNNLKSFQPPLFFCCAEVYHLVRWLTSETILSSVDGHKYTHTYPVGHIDTMCIISIWLCFIYAFHFLALICPALLLRNFSFNLIFSLLMQRQVESSSESSDWHLSWHSHFNSNSDSYSYSCIPISASVLTLSPLECVICFSQFRLLILYLPVFILNGSMSQVTGALLIGKFGDEISDYHWRPKID